MVRVDGRRLGLRSIDKVPYLRGNLHTHTRLSDGELTPEAAVRAYRERAYDFVAFTDHRCFLGEGEPEARAYFARLPASDPGFVVLRGIEEEPTSIRRRHVGVIRGDREVLRILNHPSEYGMSVEAVLDSVRIAELDAVEVTCHGRYLAAFDVEALNTPKVATDDMHYVHEIGVSWVEVEARREPDAILRALKHGDFECFVGGQPLSLVRRLEATGKR